ncbi:MULTISPECIES: hypothetical protein [Listeria]|uniref:hypothetical protein n=1 Tax=Listeria TaxID=1637 RepID=UPI001F088161|nr:MULTISPECIES: hypothetical protein [Listeria]
MLENEERLAVKLARAKKLGQLTFFRYFLVEPIAEETARIVRIEEVYAFMKGIQEGEAEIMFSSIGKDKTVFLVTGKWGNRAHFNVMLDFSGHNSSKIKKFEIAGLEGLFQFDTTTENAFYSNFLNTESVKDHRVPSAQGRQLFELILSEKVIDLRRLSF